MSHIILADINKAINNLHISLTSWNLNFTVKGKHSKNRIYDKVPMSVIDEMQKERSNYDTSVHR